ncbi:O-antigen ligase family protein [Sphingosinicella humi]|nr:O-antigen ligase family protein [Sphingosinicella humi]
MTKEQLAAIRVPLLLALLLPLVMVIQLIPLPPAIWTKLPGRELYAMAAPLAGIEQPWRPISLVPYRTWNSLFAWLVPIAMLLLVARLDREQRFALLPILIGLGFISGIVGLAQAIGPSNGPFYFYEITNNGSAVGLFSNRNHQAALLACLFPMLAVYASIDHPSVSRVRLTTLLCGAAATFILPLLLVTGSRAGLVLGMIGLVAGALLYGNPMHGVGRLGSRRSWNGWLFIAGAAIVLLIGVTVMASRATSLQRLLASDETEELRIQLLAPIWEMIKVYFPVGIGFGAFPDVYKVHEPFELLSTQYVNHAHNDLLEFILEGGLPSIFVLLTGIAFWSAGAYQLRLVNGGHPTRTVLFARLGATIILILGLASIVDYPLRVPSISAVFGLSMIWMSFGPKHPIRGGAALRMTKCSVDSRA